VSTEVIEKNTGLGNPDKPSTWLGLEEWDFRTPKELIERLVKECASRVA